MNSKLKDMVWVFAEQTDGVLADVSLELLHKARTLAQKMNSQVSAVLLGDQVEDLS